jgi:hypothetical protein
LQEDTWTQLAFWATRDEIVMLFAACVRGPAHRKVLNGPW